MRKPGCILFLLLAALGVAQNPTVDSLRKALREAADEAGKIEAMSALSLQLQAVDAGVALQYADSAAALARARGDAKGEAAAYNLRGDALWYLGNFPGAQEAYFKGLKIDEANNDSAGMASNYRDLGWVFISEEKSEQALPHFERAYAINKWRNDHLGLSQNCNDLSIVYRYRRDFKKALAFSQEAIGLARQYLNDHNLESYYGSQALIYQDMGEFDKASEMLLGTLAIAEKKGLTTTMVNCYINLGGLAVQQKDLIGAIEYLLRSLELARRINYRQAVAESHLTLAAAYEEKGDYRQAFLQHKQYNLVKDSLLNAESQEQLVEMQTRYETEKKDKELIKKEKQLTLQAAENERQTFQRNLFIGGFALMFVLAFFLYRSYRQKRIANFKLQKQKEIIEEKQKEILDSIHYARRIQSVLLPSDRFIVRVMNRLQKE